jgi:hypothetical protein
MEVLHVEGLDRGLEIGRSKPFSIARYRPVSAGDPERALRRVSFDTVERTEGDDTDREKAKVKEGAGH